jgi:hypothetical protein
MKWFRRRPKEPEEFVRVGARLPKHILEAQDLGKWKVAIVMPVPTEMTGVLREVETLLSPELGGDTARRISKVLTDHEWARVKGGWLPMAKALNMIEVQASFPHNDAMILYASHGVIGQNIAEQRNVAVERALDVGMDWIWFQDWDVKIPPTTFGILQSADVDIISGTYSYKMHGGRTMAMVPPNFVHFDAWWQKAGEEFAPGQKFGPGQIYPGLAVVPCGCLLVKADVFRKIDKPWFGQGSAVMEGGGIQGWTDDGHFCLKATQAGYTLHLDTRIMCDHIDFWKGVVYTFDVNNCKWAWRWLSDPDDTCRPFSGEVADLGYIERAQGQSESETGGGDSPPLDG